MPLPVIKEDNNNPKASVQKNKKKIKIIKNELLSPLTSRGFQTNSNVKINTKSKNYSPNNNRYGVDYKESYDNLAQTLNHLHFQDNSANSTRYGFKSTSIPHEPASSTQNLLTIKLIKQKMDKAIKV